MKKTSSRISHQIAKICGTSWSFSLWIFQRHTFQMVMKLCQLQFIPVLFSHRKFNFVWRVAARKSSLCFLSGGFFCGWTTVPTIIWLTFQGWPKELVSRHNWIQYRIMSMWPIIRSNPWTAFVYILYCKTVLK